MPTTNTIVIDAVDIAVLLLNIQQRTGQPAADGLAILLPNIEADKREAILNDAQILQEQKDNANLPDDAPTGEL